MTTSEAVESNAEEKVEVEVGKKIGRRLTTEPSFS